MADAVDSLDGIIGFFDPSEKRESRRTIDSSYLVVGDALNGALESGKGFLETFETE